MDTYAAVCIYNQASLINCIYPIETAIETGSAANLRVGLRNGASATWSADGGTAIPASGGASSSPG